MEALLQDLTFTIKSFFSPYYDQIQIAYETKQERDNMYKIIIYYKYIIKERVYWGGYAQLVNKEMQGMLAQLNYVIGETKNTIYYQEDSILTPLILASLTKVGTRIQVIDGWYEVENDIVRPASEEILLQGNIITQIIYTKILEEAVESRQKMFALPVFINDTTFISIFTMQDIPPENPIKLFEVKAELLILMNRVQILLDLFNIAEEVKKYRKKTYLTIGFSKRLTEEENKIGVFLDISSLTIQD